MIRQEYVFEVVPWIGGSPTTSLFQQSDYFALHFPIDRSKTPEGASPRKNANATNATWLKKPDTCGSHRKTGIWGYLEEPAKRREPISSASHSRTKLRRSEPFFLIGEKPKPIGKPADLEGIFFGGWKKPSFFHEKIGAAVEVYYHSHCQFVHWDATKTAVHPAEMKTRRFTPKSWEILETFFPIGFLFKGTHLGFFLCEVGKLDFFVWSRHGNGGNDSQNTISLQHMVRAAKTKTWRSLLFVGLLASFYDVWTWNWGRYQNLRSKWERSKTFQPRIVFQGIGTGVPLQKTPLPLKRSCLWGQWPFLQRYSNTDEQVVEGTPLRWRTNGEKCRWWKHVDVRIQTIEEAPWERCSTPVQYFFHKMTGKVESFATAGAEHLQRDQRKGEFKQSHSFLRSLCASRRSTKTGNAYNAVFSQGFGDVGSCQPCWCTHLYGEQKPWGCKWWTHWIQNDRSS